MPYKNPVKQREACRLANRRMRARNAVTVKVTKNRLGFLELEVARLNRCLEVALNR